MTDRRHVAVPVGISAQRWMTVTPARTVLMVAHNVTTVTRLLDVLTAFDNDSRIQLVFTQIGADPFQHGLSETIDNTGMITIPWEQAVSTRFDLAISASHHGELADISAPLIILSHGIGYTKYSPRKPETGNRKPETGNRKPETGNRKPFGLSAQWVLRDGQPFASALVLSHEDQLRQLAENAPEALSTAVVAGDPCFDRIAAGVAFRARYRAALGVGDRTLVLVSSTWSPSSLLGSRPELLRELVAELPLDTHVVAVALHPNIAHGHGPGQITHWFADCLRSGLIILPEIDGWRAGVIAADVVVGDHGSVTGYSAAIGRPVLLAAFDDVPPATPIAALGDIAPRLPTLGPFAPHLAAAIQSHRPTRFAAVADLVTSVPGQSLERLRSLFYQLLELAEPPAETAVDIVPVPVRPASRSLCFANLVSCQVDERRRLVRLVRHAAEVQRPGVGYHRDRADDAYLSCSLDYPIHSLVVNSAVLAVTGPVDLPAWQEIFDQRPACMIIATLREGGATLLHRDGTVITLQATTLPAEALASVAYAWQATGQSLQSLAPTVQVELGGPIHDVTVTVSSA